MTLERKTFAFKLSKKGAVLTEDKTAYEFEGYLSTFGNVDFGGDVVVKGAFVKSLKRIMPKLLWVHKMDEPLGIFVEIYEDNKGLFVRGRMPVGDTLVEGRVIPQMKIGSVDRMSIGFDTVESHKDKDGVRFLTEIMLFEGSLLSLAMNDQALVKSLISKDNLKSLNKKDLESRLIEGHKFSKKAAKIIASTSTFLEPDLDVDVKGSAQRDAVKTDEFSKEDLNGIKNLTILVKGENAREHTGRNS